MNEEQAREQVESFRQALAEVGFDGPFEFPQGGIDPFKAVFGGSSGARDTFAICLRCGSMIVLGDPMERPDRSPVERGVWLHVQWHEERQ